MLRFSRLVALKVPELVGAVVEILRVARELAFMVPVLVKVRVIEKEVIPLILKVPELEKVKDGVKDVRELAEKVPVLLNAPVTEREVALLALNVPELVKVPFTVIPLFDTGVAELLVIVPFDPILIPFSVSELLGLLIIVRVEELVVPIVK